MSERGRPDPDALLALVQAEGAHDTRSRGRLKIFFGATAGVGKTFAMLEAARERRRGGADVVVGLVETHGRRETEALLEGLEVLPRRARPHRGVALQEFDVDAALARHPQVLLVDELAHTNAPGSRHDKRWQDVDELRAAGIDVYTTLNVQHVESLNDVVARITGVTVRETVPDSVIDSADEVELIDLPPEALLERLREGKVYLPEQAERAMEKFFRKGNLTALRQMALLRTADRVDRQMEVFRRAQAVGQTWPVRDRLLVGVGPAPSSERLVRSTRRMADRLGAEWTAAFVETPAAAHWPQADRDRVWETLRLAEQLGGRTVTLHGGDAATEILAYARAHNVTKLVVGKPTHTTWRDLFGQSFHDRMVRGSGSIDVYVITGQHADGSARPVRPRAPGRSDGRAYGLAALAVAVATAVAGLLYPVLERTNLVMFYLLAIVAIAMRAGRGPVALAAVLSVAAFDFFFVPPHLTFAVSDTQYVVTFGVMLAVGLVIGTLTARLREQGEAARRRERRTSFLYEASRELARTADTDAMLRLVLPHLADALDGSARVLRADALGTLVEQPVDGAPTGIDASQLGIAGWVHANRRPAGLGTDTFAARAELYLPVATSSHSFGVLLLVPRDRERIRAPEQLHLLEAVASQLATAIERARLAEEARGSRAREAVDALRSEFVSVATHELRAPIRSLARHLGRLRGMRPGMHRSPEDERELRAAAAEVQRLTSLVDELVDLSRGGDRGIGLERSRISPAELVRRVVEVMRERAVSREVSLRHEVDEDLPLLEIDVRRIEGVLATLLERALRDAPPDGHVVVSADVVGRYVQIAVADDGPGIPLEEQSRLFDVEGGLELRATTGATTGLALAREVVRAHRGVLWVDSGPGPGSVFSFTLPIESRPTASVPPAVPDPDRAAATGTPPRDVDDARAS